ncbi:MAG: hypothetical protein AMXMBFR53_37500 [Gemmatimonadota bacterium]
MPPFRPCAWTALLVLVTVAPLPLRAQGREATSFGISAYAGLGPVFDNGSLVSWTGNLLVEADATHGPWRVALHASVRGIGAACADACDLSGDGVGLGVARLVGPVGVGAGMGALHQGGRWYAQPHAVLTAGRGTLRAQLRLELPQGAFGVSAPVLVGGRVPVG